MESMAPQLCTFPEKKQNSITELPMGQYNAALKYIEEMKQRAPAVLDFLVTIML